MREITVSCCCAHHVYKHVESDMHKTATKAKIKSDKAAPKTRIGELEYGLQQTVAQARAELRQQDDGFRAAYKRYVEEAHEAAQVECAHTVAAERQRSQSETQRVHQ